MRTDVKFALAVAGILLAVIIAYSILPDSTDPQVQLVDESGQAVQSPLRDVAPTPVASQSVTPVSPVPTQTDLTAPQPRPAPVETVVTPVSPADEQSVDVWTIALRTGNVPMLSQTPPVAAEPPAGTDAFVDHSTPAAVTPDPESDSDDVNPLANRPVSDTPVSHEGAALPYTGAASSSGVSSSYVGAASREDRPTTQPITGERTYVVQNGDTFSSISAKAYGSPNYWPHIARRNPQVNPSKLQIGTVLTLPDPASVRSPVGPTASAGASRPINPNTEYRVREGDSLHRISVRLYGKADRVDELYEWNRQVIGSDPRKIRPGMILQLREPPTVTASTQ